MQFDASQVDPRQSEGGICLPLADYPMEIVKIENIATKDNPNKGFMAISLKVLDGQYINQVQIDRLNLYGQAETPTRIAYQRLSAYCHIAGKMRINDERELIGTKLIATCGPQDPPNEKYSDVKMVKDLAGNPPVWGQPSAPQTTQPAQTQQPQQQGWQQPQGQQQPPAPAASPWNNPAQQPPAPAQTQPPQQQGWNNAAPATASATPPWVK